MNHEDRMRKIMLDDAKRHISRREREDMVLSNDPTSRAALADWTCETPLKRGSGLIPLSDTRRKTPRRAPRTVSHGAAAMPPNAQAAARLAAGDVDATVLCYTRNPDGSTTEPTVRNVSDFRTSKTRKTRTTTPDAPTHRTEAKDLPALFAD
jgi:hypothetical protein